MKLLNLNLKAIGPFTDVTLDLSGGEHGLHVIFGQNEAGKSSTMRALSYLLFGFPHSLADDFLHKYDQLRVGAVLRHGDGEILEVVRRKAGKNDLRAGDDSAVVEPERLARFLGHLDQESFHHRFGIDHSRLRMAGEEIRAGKGHLGEMLFAAGAGLAGLRQVQQNLQERSGNLFKPRGQNQKINAALNDLREAQAAQKEHRLPNEEWRKHHEALKRSEERAETLAGEISGLRKERNRLDRLMTAIPLVARRRRLLAEQASHGDAPLLRADFGKEARLAADALLIADRTIAQADEAIASVAVRLEQTHPAAEVLAAAGEIESLQQRLGAVEKAARDRVERDNLRKDKEHRAGQILRELGHPVDLELARTIQLRADEPKMIRALGQRRAQPLGQLDLTRADIARHEDMIADSERSLAELPMPPDVSGLKKALRDAQKGGELDSRIDEAGAELAKAEKKVSLALARLPDWDRSAADLQRLPVPCEEALNHFEARFRAIEWRHKETTSARSKAAEAIRDLEAQIRAIEHAGDVPLAADLDAARDRRDLGWRLIRDSWIGTSPTDAVLASFLGEGKPRGALADSFEESVRLADQIGDRLRRESTNVANKARGLSEIRKHAEQVESLDRELREIEAEGRRLEAEWADAIGFLARSRGRSVAEVRAWLRDREKAVQLIEKVQDAREQLEPIESARSRGIDAIRAALGEQDAAANPDDRLAHWVERAESVIRDADGVVRRREELEAAIRTAKAELATARRAHESARVKLEEWEIEWASKMGRIGLEPDASPVQAEDVLARIKELEDVLHEHAGFVSRIKGIDRDEAEFRSAVDALALRTGLKDAGATAYDRARSLSRLLKEQIGIEVARASLVEQLQKEQDKLIRAKGERETCRAILVRLCREAGCADPEDLAAIEERSNSRTRVEDELRTCEEQLLVVSSGVDIEAFSAEVGQLDPDELSASLGRLGDATAVLEEELKEVHRTVGAERGELARMDGNDDRANQDAENVQAYLARIQGDVARYAALRLSSVVLRRAVERYREKSQGPVLARASSLFADLTGGSFTGLRIDDEGDGRMILKGVRQGGRQVGVEGMSEGAHDQLYLALRLASLETWLESNEPIPFVVDDILITFDDQRATAALRALADLSRLTQVLFFTHSHRLVELARTELSPDEVFVQELPRRA